MEIGDNELDIEFIDNSSDKVISKEEFPNNPISEEQEEIGYISKYIREDSKDNEMEANDFKQRFKSKDSGTIEVFGSVGEGESFSENNGFKKRYNQDGRNNWDGGDDENDDDKANSGSEPTSRAKKEFLDKIQEDSLTIDTCSNVGRDWKK